MALTLREMGAQEGLEQKMDRMFQAPSRWSEGNRLWSRTEQGSGYCSGPGSVSRGGEK